MASLLPFKRIVNQINPFDNGRTYKQLTPTKQGSVVQQATHNGATNLIGGIAKPLVRGSLAINQGIANAELKLAGRPTINGRDFANQAIGRNANKAVDYTGTKRQIAGDAISNVVNVAAPGSSKFITKTATSILPKALPKLIPKVISSVAVGAPAGAVGNLGGYVAGEDKLTFKDALKTAQTGAIYGGLTGAAVPIAAPVAKIAGKATAKGAKAIDREVRASNDKKGLAANYDTTINNLQRQKQALQGRIQNTDNFRGVETTQRHIDQIDGQIAEVIANKPKLSIKDRVLAPNVGLGMKAVHSPDLLPEQNQFIEEYAKMLKDNGQGNGVDMVKTADGYKRVSNNVRDAADKGKTLNNSYWFDKARKEIESGKAAYGASDEYRNIGQIVDEPPLQIPEGFEGIGQPTPKELELTRLQHIVDNPGSKQITAGEYSAAQRNLRNLKKSNGSIITLKGGTEVDLTSAAFLASKQAIKPSSAAKPTPRVRDMPKPVKQSVKSLPDNTAINVNKYLKQQTKAQEVARKAGDPTGFGKVKAAGKEFKSKLVDSLAPIEDTLNQKITKENATSHITPQLDRAIRADTIAGQYVRDNGLDKVIQKVDNTKEFDQYLIAKHAADLEKNGIKTGRNSGADAQLVKEFGSKYEAQAKQVQKYSQDLLDKAADYGLISKELATELKQKYPNYVPANRIFGDNELTTPKGTGGGKASIGSQTVVQKIKGSSRAIESPLASILNKTKDVIEQGERNKAAQILTGYKDLPGNPFNLRQLAKDETVGNKHVVSVLQDGKKLQFETTKEIADAAKSLSKEQLGLVGKILAIPTRVLRLGATSLNPAFTGANIVKDLASGALNSKNPLRSSVANPTVFLKALAAATNHNSKAYQELVREGAGGTSYDIARDAPRQTVARVRAQKNAGTKALYTVTHPSELLRAAENTIGRSEEFSRAMQYFGGKQAAKAKGATDDAARVMGAHAARNNTINFARAGDYGRVLNSVLPYLNAGIQGSRTFVRNIGDNPAQMITKVVVLGSLPTAAITAWNISTPDRKAAYDDIKDYEKHGNWIIVPPNPIKGDDGKWNVIKIPVSQELASLNNTVRSGIEAGIADGTFKVKELGSDLFGAATSIQTESPRQFLGQVTPQAVKPVLESVVNQNLFTGNQIVPTSQKNLDAPDQIGKSTSGTAKVVGKLTNQSPRKIDNFVRTAAGGLGQNLINVSDNVLAKTGQIKPNEIKGKAFDKSIQSRFSGAQGSTEYDKIDTKTADLTKKLKATDGYKQMTPEDKAKALNRLTSTITQTYTTKDKLSARQQAIDDGSVKVEDYLKPAAKTTTKSTTVNQSVPKSSKQILDSYDKATAEERKATNYKQADYEYNVAKAKYENDKANKTLSTAADIRAQATLTKLEAGKSYSKDTRDLYGLTKQQILSYVSTNRDGNKIASDLKAYDQALYDKGINTTLKFKYGFGNGTRSSGGTGKATKFKTSSIPKIRTSLYKLPRQKIAKAKMTSLKSKKAVYRSPKITSNVNAKLKLKTA